MPIRRAVTSHSAACAALAMLLALGGCSLADRASGPDAAGAEPTPTAEKSPESRGASGGEAKRHTSAVELDGVVLHIASRKAAVVRTDEDEPGLRTVTLTLAPGGSADLTLVSPGVLDVDSDGSITVLDGDGTPVAAVGPPSPPSDMADDAPRIEVTETDATRARVGLDDRTRQTRRSSPAGEQTRPGRLDISLTVGTRAIRAATWGENEGGRSLAVDPASWARHAGRAGLDLIRTQLVAAVPEAGSATMDDQLVCHAVGAPDKSTWNLEPWRPDVGLILTAAAHCNPV